MEIKSYKQLYAATFVDEDLEKFWEAALYDLEAQSLDAWCTLKSNILKNAEEQKQVLKEAFADEFPESLPQLAALGWSCNDIVDMLETYPELLQGTAVWQKLNKLSSELPHNENTEAIFAYVEGSF